MTVKTSGLVRLSEREKPQQKVKQDPAQKKMNVFNSSGQALIEFLGVSALWVWILFFTVSLGYFGLAKYWTQVSVDHAHYCLIEDRSLKFCKEGLHQRLKLLGPLFSVTQISGQKARSSWGQWRIELRWKIFDRAFETAQASDPAQLHRLSQKEGRLQW